MIFNSAEVLSISQNSQLIGDSFALRTIQDISVSSRLINNQTNKSLKPIWSGIDELTNFTGYEAIILNGVNIGTGRLVSLNFQEDTDTRFKRYTADLQILKDAGNYNITGLFYADITGYIGLNFKYINNLQENCTFNKISQDIYETSQTLTLEIDSYYNGDSKTLAKTIASGFLKNTPFLQLIGVTMGDIYLNSGNGLYFNNESHDNINQIYSFTQRIETTPSGFYNWKYSNVLSYEVDGTINLSENGNITATRILNGNKYSYASSGWDIVRTGIYSRITGLYNAYFKNPSGEVYFSGNCGIVNQPVQSSITKNIYAGTIDYNYSYSNSPTLNSGYSYSYEDEISMADNGYLNITEQGEIKGFLKNRPANFTFVTGKWSQIKPTIYPRITGYLQSYTLTENCLSNLTGYLVNSNESYSEYNGTVGYNYAYTTDPDNMPSGDFLRISVSRSDVSPVHSVAIYAVAHFGELAQFTKQSTRGSYTNKINIQAKTGVSLSSILDAGFARVLKPSGTDIYLSDFNYSYSPQINSLDMDLSYSYSKYREGNDILV